MIVLFVFKSSATASAPLLEIPLPAISTSVQYSLEARALQISIQVSSGVLLNNELLGRFTRVKSGLFAFKFSIQFAGN